MPCDSSYMEPSQREIESKRVATLILYVKRSLDDALEDWIIEASDNCYGNVKELDKLTLILCDLCKILDNETKELIIYNVHDPVSRDLADWWEEHQEADKLKDY